MPNFGCHLFFRSIPILLSTTILNDIWYGATVLICLECMCSYRPLFFHLAILLCVFGQGKLQIGAYTSDNILCEKCSNRKMAEDYQWKILIGKMLTN